MAKVAGVTCEQERQRTPLKIKVIRELQKTEQAEFQEEMADPRRKRWKDLVTQLTPPEHLIRRGTVEGFRRWMDKMGLVPSSQEFTACLILLGMLSQKGQRWADLKMVEMYF